MLDARITKPGTILIHDGYAHIEGFEVENADSCREVAIAALLWGAKLMLEEAMIDIEAPGKCERSGLDLPPVAWPLMNMEWGFVDGRSKYQVALAHIKGMQCRHCQGLGTCDDAEPGDIGYREWECPDCQGTGFSSEYRPAERETDPGSCVTDPA